MSAAPRSLGKVAVLMGGRSAEREVSFMSGQGVLTALRAQGVDAHPFDPAERNLSDLKTENFDRCFIALHGRFGEDGTVQGALELLGIPYTGSGVMASSIAIDKTMTKRVWLSEGVPTPKYVLLKNDNLGDAAQAQVLQTLGLPLIVKPAREGSSIGVFKVVQANELQQALNEAAKCDTDILCEQFIAGDEVTCPVLGDGDNAEALPVIRIVAPAGNYDYEHKYFTDDTQYLVPSGLPESEEKAIQAHVLKAYRVLGCKGWGRVDVMITSLVGNMMEQVKEGRIKLIATTGPERNSTLNNIPTVAEGGVPNFGIRTWTAVFAPANTPLDVVAKLNRAVAEIQKDGQIQKKIESLAMDVSVGSPQELSTMLAKESDFYSVILKRTNTKLD